MVFLVFMFFGFSLFILVCRFACQYHGQPICSKDSSLKWPVYVSSGTLDFTQLAKLTESISVSDRY